MELISVIVPIYKVEAYLDRCVQSITAQTYKNLEIILVDDGSPDGCGAICDGWAEKDSRVRVIHKENGGLSDARNAGLAVASGSLIAFIDSDDTVDPRFLEAMYSAMTAAGAEAAECSISHVDENGRVLRVEPVAPEDRMDRPEALRRLVMEDGIYTTAWNKLYRRSLLDGLTFPVGKLNEDEFWTYRVYDRISTLAVVRDPLYNYLHRGSSIIGAGYNIRRLDGLEGRFQRMEYLQKYESLAPLARQQVLLHSLWHYQAATRCLRGQEREKALAYISGLVARIAPVPRARMTLGLKYRLWLRLYRAAPDLTVRLRNLLKIGV